MSKIPSFLEYINEGILKKKRTEKEGMKITYQQMEGSFEEIIKKSDCPDLDSEMFIETTYTNSRGKTYKSYLMNRDGLSLVAMGFNGPKAIKFKLDFIAAFNQLEDMLKRIREERTNTLIEREKGKVVRNALTDVIKKMIADSPHKKFAYANYTKLIYKICFGMTMDELRAKYGATTKESVRDLMSADDLAEVSHKEFLVCGLINEGWGYKEIRNFMEANCRPAIEPSLKLDTAN